MWNHLQKKWPHLVIPFVIALLSVFLLSPVVSSADFHQETLDALNEKQTTVLELSAASATASAAITLIPGDVATPIAEKMSDLSSHFLLVLCAIFLEKYLLTITGSIAFSLLIPLACGLYILQAIFNWKSLRLLAAKLAVFGLLIFAIIPASVWVSDHIEATYQASIQATIDAAKETSSELKDQAAAEEKEDKGLLPGIISSVTEGVSGVVTDATARAGELINNFMEALAVMLVTCCVIPILVLLSFIWFAKILLSIDLPVTYGGLHRGVADAISHKKQAVTL